MLARPGTSKTPAAKPLMASTVRHMNTMAKVMALCCAQNKDRAITMISTAKVCAKARHGGRWVDGLRRADCHKRPHDHPPGAEQREEAPIVDQAKHANCRFHAGKQAVAKLVERISARRQLDSCPRTGRGEAKSP